MFIQPNILGDKFIPHIHLSNQILGEINSSLTPKNDHVPSLIDPQANAALKKQVAWHTILPLFPKLDTRETFLPSELEVPN
jgi:hypothetical protein